MTELAFGADASLDNVMRTMRAMRRLKPDPVPRELLTQLVEAATYAPSGGNAQTYSYVVVDDREQMAQFAPIWQRIQRWYVTTQTPPPHMSADEWSATMRALEYQAEHFAETPAIIVPCYEVRDAVRRTMKTVDKQRAGMRLLGARKVAGMTRNMPKFVNTGVTASVYPSVQNLLLMARALGLGATLTTWHTLFEHEVKAVLGIPRHVHTYAIIPIGYPKGNFGPVKRRPADEAIHWDRW